MGYSNRDNRSGGGRHGGFGGGRSFDRPTMYSATCDNCGKECKVPFRPTGSKPVFCKDCFSLAGGLNDRSDFQGSERRDSRRSESNSARAGREDRRMYDAVCDNCGKDCKVPFQPTSGKPVLCSDCFERNGQRRTTHAEVDYKQQFEELNAKVDKILEILSAAAALDAEEVASNAMENEVTEDATSDVAIEEPEVAVEEPAKPAKKVKTKATLAAAKKRASKKTSTKKK